MVSTALLCLIMSIKKTKTKKLNTNMIKTKKINRGEKLMDTSKLYALSRLPHNNSEEGCDF